MNTICSPMCNVQAPIHNTDCYPLFLGPHTLFVALCLMAVNSCGNSAYSGIICDPLVNVGGDKDGGPYTVTTTEIYSLVDERVHS